MKIDFPKVLVVVVVAGIAAAGVWWFAGTINNERQYLLVKHQPVEAAKPTTWQGKLVSGGVECQRFQADNGQFYTLGRTDLLTGLKTGDRIAVTGTVATMSTCQQDTTIVPTLILRGK
jgi:hypothetical protein